MAAGEKVKIRIALVVNSEGRWNAVGWSEGDDKGAMASCLDGLESESAEQRYWVELEIDRPAEATVVSGSATSA